MKTTRLYDRLEYQHLGPSVICGKIIDVPFRLDLPQHMHLHLVFNVSLLEPYVRTSIPDRDISPPPPVELAEGLEYDQVEPTLDSKIMHNKLYYVVDWLRYIPNDQTWGTDKECYQCT